MQRYSRKSINPRDSFHLPRHSDGFGNTSVDADQLHNLRNISVAARPSLMPSPNHSQIIPDNSDVTSADLKRRFPDDPEWYQRLPKLSRPSFTPRAQTRTLRQPRGDGDDAADVSSEKNEEQASVSDATQTFRKPFRKKKQLFDKSRGYEKVFDDTTFTEKDSQIEKSSREAPKTSLPIRRSNRLRSKTVDNPVSPMESPRETFRRWKSALPRRSSVLAEAFEDLRTTNAIIDESSESSSYVNQPSSAATGDSDNAPQTETGRKRLQPRFLSEENKSVSASESSLTSPPLRPKPFKKARKSRRSFGACFDETSDSSASAAQPDSAAQTETGRESQSKILSEESKAVSADEVSLTSPPLRPKPFEKAKKNRRSFGAFFETFDSPASAAQSDSAAQTETGRESQSKILIEENQAVSADEASLTSPPFRPKPFEKLREGQRSFCACPDEKSDSSSSAARTDTRRKSQPKILSEENKAVSAHEASLGSPPLRQKPFERRHQQRGSSAYADAFESEDSSIAETAIVGESENAAAVNEIPPSTANDPQNRRRGQLRSSPAVGVSRTSNVSSNHSETVDQVSPRPVDVVELARPTSLVKRGERKSHRSSVGIAARGDIRLLSEVPQGEDLRLSQSFLQRRRLEKELSSPDPDTLVRSSARLKGWAIAKEKGRMDELEEILSMDTSSIDSFSNNKENEPNHDANGFGREAMPIVENDFVVPTIPSKLTLWKDRMCQRGSPRVVIVPLRDGVFTSTPTPNATEMLLASPISSIANLSKQPNRDLTSNASDKVAIMEAPVQSHPRTSPSGPGVISLANPDGAVEYGVTTPTRKSRVSEQSQNRRQSSRLRERSASAEKMSEKDEDLPSTAERSWPSPTSKSLPKRKSRTSEQPQNRRQSSRHRERSTSTDTMSEEDEDLSTAERSLLSPTSKFSLKRKSRASEQSQNRTQPSRRRERSASAEKMSEEDEDLSTAERLLLSPTSKFSLKRKSRASEQSKNRRQSSRHRERSASAEKMSEEDEDLSTAERSLLSPTSKFSLKRKSRASEQSQNRTQPSRHRERSASAEKMSEEDEDLSTAERSLLSPTAETSPKGKSRASEQSQNKKNASSQVARSIRAMSSEEDDANEDLSTSDLKSPSKRKPTSAGPLRNQSSLLRQESRSRMNYKEYSGVEKEKPGIVSLSSQNKSSSPANQQLTIERRKKEESLRIMVSHSSSMKHSVGEEDDAVLSLSSSSLPSQQSRSLAKETSLNRRSSSRKQDMYSNESLKRNPESDLPSLQNTLSAQTSKFLRKRSSLFSQIVEKKFVLYENVGLSPEISNRADQTKRTLPKQTGGDNTRQPEKDSTRKAESIRRAESHSGESMESEESDKIPASSTVGRKLSSPNNAGNSASAALSVSSADNISPDPVESMIGGSRKSAFRKRSEETGVMSSKEGSRSNIQATEKAPGCVDESENKDALHEPVVSSLLRQLRDGEGHTRVSDLPKRRSSAAAGETPREGKAMPPPKKSVIPQRVRSDIRTFFTKSTPLKEPQSDDSSDTLVPLNATAITPIRKSGALSAGGSLFSHGASDISENPPNEVVGPKLPNVPRPASSRVEELVKQLLERVSRKNVQAAPSLPRPVLAVPKPKAKALQKPAKKKFQLMLPDGKVYKQPKLPKPRKFVSDNLYRFITKNIKNNKQLDTRVRAEEFVRRLCDTYDRVLRRKNSKELVEELLEDMVRLGLVSTYAEFYYFVDKFMPYSFRLKAIPCIGSDVAPEPRKGIHEKLEFD